MHIQFYKQKLRRLRRSYALTQKDLANLLGVKSPDYIAKLEKGLRRPSTGIVMRLVILFDLAITSLFPDVHEEASVELDKLVRSQVQQLAGTSSLRNKRKLEFYEAILSKLALQSFSNS